MRNWRNACSPLLSCPSAVTEATLQHDFGVFAELSVDRLCPPVRIEKRIERVRLADMPLPSSAVDPKSVRVYEQQFALRSLA